MIPGFRLVRRLVLFVAILGLLFVGGNVVLARVAEGKIAEAAQKEFDLPQKPSIHIGGFILLDVLRGTLPSITFVAHDVVVQDLTISSAGVDLEGIRAHGLFTGNMSVSVDRGSVRAAVTQAELNAYLRKHEGNTTIALRLNDAATVHVIRGGHTYVANGTVSLSGGSLRFTPSSVTLDGHVPPRGFEQFARNQATFEVKIPPLPGGIAVARLQTAQGSATLIATLRNRTISLGK